MDVAYQNAAARRDALAAEINKLQQRLEEHRRELTRVDTFLRDWMDFAGESPHSHPVDNGDSSISENKRPKSRAKNLPKEIVVKAAIAVIRSKGEPMSRSELYVALSELDITLEGTDPEMVLSTMLWRMKDEVVRIPNFGYWPKDTPYPPANYDPKVPHPGDAEHADMVHRDVRGDLSDLLS